jgi:DNA-binding response OmpR family regulator
MQKNRKIYIAEDETHIRLVVKAFLENAGYCVSDFENGDLLLDAFSESPADLVILDIMMPGTNGFIVCKELRKVSKIPIIMLSARASDLDYNTGFDLGCNEYITKPFRTSDLVACVEDIFNRMDEIIRGDVMN